MSLFDIYKEKQLGAGAGSLFYAKAGEKLNKDAWKKGFNKWDEETQLGFWNTNGTFATNSNGYMSSKNPIAVDPDTNYYMTIGGTGQNSFYILHLDADGNVISRSNYQYKNHREFLTPSNCHFIQFSTEAFYGTTYNNDICINVSGEHNGEYVPYSG